MAGTIERRLTELGYTLPEVPPSAGNYVPYVITGNLLYTAGQSARGADGKWLSGRVGEDISLEEAYERARLTGLQLLGTIRAGAGDLDRVKRIVKVLGMVNATPDFTSFPQVINGCSDLFVQVFGDIGRHARSAVGVGGLPEGVTVEIEVIVELAHSPLY
jgi:enamine deaminase RidA (YjgF/YER057c/UK114 family)